MGTNSRQNRKAEQAFESFARKQGEVLLVAERRFEALGDEGCEVMAIRVRFPVNEGDDYLAVVMAHVDGEKKIGFHGAESFQEALVGCLNRLYNRRMIWKDDMYAD